MRLYTLDPDPEVVHNHFVKMAKNELLPDRRQVGFGFVGSRLKLGGRTTLMRRPGLEPSSGGKHEPVLVNAMVPSEVGVQQARSQLIAQEIQKEAGRGLVKSAVKKEKRKKATIKSRVTKSKSQSGAGRGRSSKAKSKSSTIKRKKAAVKRKDNFS